MYFFKSLQLDLTRSATSVSNVEHDSHKRNCNWMEIITATKTMYICAQNYVCLLYICADMCVFKKKFHWGWLFFLSHTWGWNSRSRVIFFPTLVRGQTKDCHENTTEACEWPALRCKIRAKKKWLCCTLIN